MYYLLRILSASTLFACLATAQSGYTITDLGTLRCGATSTASAINDRGEIVGSVTIPISADCAEYHDGGLIHGEQAFIWRGAMERLPWAGDGFSRALAINNRGDVVGIWSNNRIHAVLWENNGQVQQLEPRIGGEGWARGVNDAGQIVGQRLSAAGKWTAFLLDPKKGVADLDAWPGASDAWAINARGQVIGQYSTPDRIARAFLWDDGVTTDLAAAEPRGINARGQIAFSMVIPPPSFGFHAVLWERGALTDLGNFGEGGTGVNGINARGQIVGAYDTRDHTYAFVWEQGAITTLPSLGGNQSEARAINERGEIVGWSNLPSGLWHAVLWRPVTH
jgi:probable HAF family extracellular repeat protein